MKILAIRGENIASLPEFEINFRDEPLRSSGLFAIIGPTGAGKSSLLDTICLALFNKVPRLDDAGTIGLKFNSNFGEIGQNDIIHIIRRGASTCRAEVEFLGIDGNEYKAYWGYRPPGRAKAAPKEEHVLTRLSDNQILSNGKKRDYLVDIEKLLGLKYEQFTRTVFLSQGRFAEFLKSDENSRSELLEKITGTGIYAIISKNIFERNKIESASLETLKSQFVNLQLLSPEKILEISQEVERQKHIHDYMIKLSTSVKNWKKASVDLEMIAEKFKNNKIDESKEKIVFDTSESDLATLEKSNTEREYIFEKVSILDKDLAVLIQNEINADKNLKTSLKTLEELTDQSKAALTKIANEENNIKSYEEWLFLNKNFESLCLEWTRWQHVFQDCSNSLIEQNKLNQQNKLFEASLIEVDKKIFALNSNIKLIEVELGEIDRNQLPEILDRLNKELDEIKICHDYFKVYNDLKKATKGKEDYIAKKNKAELELSPASEAAKVANQMYDLAVKSIGENVESLRSELKKGDSCPVCGSIEHPYVGKDHKLKSLIDDQRKIKELSQKHFNEVESHFTVMSTMLKTAEQQTVLNEQLIQKTAIPSSLLFIKLKDVAEIEQFQVLEDERKRVRLDVVSLNSKNTFSQNLQKLETENLKLQSDKIGLVTKMNAGNDNYTSEEARFEKFATQLDTVYGGPEWRILWCKDPGHFEKDQEKKILEYNSVLLKLKASQELFVQAEVQKNTLSLSIPTCSKTAKTNELTFKQIQNSVIVLRTERTSLFGNDTVKDVREKNELLILSKRNLKELARASLQRIKDQGTSLVGEEKGKVSEINILSNEIISFASILSSKSTGELDFDFDNVSPIKFFEHKNAIDEKIAEIDNKLQKHINDKAEREALLRQNKAAQLNAEEIQTKISIQSIAQDKWNKLNSEIGSADGKLFRKIAQAYTLDILLIHANLQLSQITSRYKLEQTGDSVHFGVIDQENYGEMRPVHTLSGGETFIVSLALALGLSSMASNGLTIESLFIDEGFGTLDSETLKCVMNALSQLQAQGRKVGLITHVEEMKEQIPTRIEVVKEGQGTSSVRITG
jgi:exonuclease SbcC